jgi:uncharacterized protein (TIGR00251 family)
VRVLSYRATVKVEVRVKPRASRSRVLGQREGLLEVAVAAPPVDGAANEALLECLADFFEVGRSALTLVRGASSRSKLVEIAGLEPDELARRVAALAR